MDLNLQQRNLEHVLWCTGHQLLLTNIIRAEGCYIYDESGKRCMDLESGVWVTPLGHNHPAVNQAIKDQLDKITHTGYCYSSEIVELSSRAVLEACGFKQGKCVFLSSGSEAVEFGIRVLCSLSGRNKLLCLHDSFLGSYGFANKKNPDEWHFLDWRECQTCEKAEICDLNCHVIREIPFESLSGFVLEPGSASGLVRFPPSAFIHNLVKMIKSSGGRIHINEITTGIGRSGKWFGFQHYDIQPDLISMGKGLGNGYPISAIAISGEVAGMLDENSFYYQQSHQNDPLGCRVAKEVIEVIRKDHLIDKCKEKGEYLLSQLKLFCEGYVLLKRSGGVV